MRWALQRWALVVAAALAVLVVPLTVGAAVHLRAARVAAPEPAPAAPGPAPHPVLAPQPAGAPVPPVTGAWLGAWVRPDLPTAQGRLDAVADFEGRLGRPLDVAHTYHRWDEAFPDRADRELAAGGRTVLLSWAGTDTRQIQAGLYDDLVRQRARDLKEWGAPVLLEWRWEMDRPNLQGEVWGPADYVAAWRHLRAVFAAEQVHNAAWVWCPLAAGFADGRAQEYYPGDREVDWLCADTYPGRTVQPFGTAAAAFLLWARAHPHPVVIGETGMKDTAGEPARQAWLADLAAFVPTQPQIKARRVLRRDPWPHPLRPHPGELRHVPALRARLHGGAAPRRRRPRLPDPRVTARPDGPVVVGVLSHRDPPLVRRLVERVLEGERSVALVHHDPRGPALDLPRDERVVVLPDPRPCDWGRPGLALAVLRLVGEAAARVPDLSWFLLVSGQDYPTRAFRDVERELAASTRDGHVRSFPVDADPSGDVHPWQAVTRRRYLTRVRLPHTHRSVPAPRRWPDPGTRLFVGDMWVDLGAAAVHHVLEQRPRLAAVERYLLRCKIPDEALLPTLLLNDAGHLDLSGERRRYLRWTEGDWHPAQLDDRDLEPALASDAFFARKLDSVRNAALLDAMDARGVASRA